MRKFLACLCVAAATLFSAPPAVQAHHRSRTAAAAAVSVNVGTAGFAPGAVQGRMRLFGRRQQQAVFLAPAAGVYGQQVAVQASVGYQQQQLAFAPARQRVFVAAAAAPVYQQQQIAAATADYCPPQQQQAFVQPQQQVVYQPLQQMIYQPQQAIQAAVQDYCPPQQAVAAVAAVAPQQTITYFQYQAVQGAAAAADVCAPQGIQGVYPGQPGVRRFSFRGRF